MPFHRIRPELEGLSVPIDSVEPHPDNPNSGDIDAIAESMALNGQYAPIIIWAETGEILAGNTRHAAALSLGWSHIAALPVSAETREEALRILLVDNRSARLARMDEGLLLAALRGVGDLSGTGYGSEDVRRLERLVSAPLTFGGSPWPEVSEPAGTCPACGK